MPRSIPLFSPWLRGRVRCHVRRRAAGFVAEGMISGLGACSIGALLNACLSGKTLPRSPQTGSSPGATSRRCSAVLVRDAGCCLARSRIHAAFSVGFPSVAGCRCSRSMLVAGIGSAERRGSIFRPGWRRRSSASAARARRREPAVACSHSWRSVMTWARVCSRCW